MSESPWPVAEWLEMLALSVWVRESLYGFAIVVGFHIVSLSVSAGTIVWFDLRLLGVSMTGVPVPALYRRLVPWTIAGFVWTFATGLVLFAAYATPALENQFFWIKMGVIAAAGVNAAVYHVVTARHVAAAENGAVLPPGARAAGLISILAWTTAILAGRLMAYTMY